MATQSKLDNKIVAKLIFFLENKKAKYMISNTLVEDCNAQKQKIKEASRILEDAVQDIVLNYSYDGVQKNFIPRPSHLCIARYHKGRIIYNDTKTYARFEEDETFTDICDEMKDGKVCKKADCPGFCNYTKYRVAQKNYDEEVKKLSEYPLWVRIATLLKSSEDVK